MSAAVARGPTALIFVIKDVCSTIVSSRSSPKLIVCRDNDAKRGGGEWGEIHTFEEVRSEDIYHRRGNEWPVRYTRQSNSSGRGQISSMRRWGTSRRKVNEESGSHGRGRGVKTWTDEEAAKKLASLRPRNDGQLIIVRFKLPWTFVPAQLGWLHVNYIMYDQRSVIMIILFVIY